MRPLDQRDLIRARPGMYVGGTDARAALDLVLELVANAVDQHLAGRCSHVVVDIADESVITVRDDGPGLADPATALEVYSHRPTVDGHRPHVHLGLGGLGLVVVNALSEHLGISTIRDGVESRAIYERGEQIEAWSSIRTSAPNGTAIRFRLDPTIFTQLVPDPDELDERLTVLAHLLPRLDFGRNHTGVGLRGRVARRAGCAEADVIYKRDTVDRIDVELAIAFGDRAGVEGFTNLEPNSDGGSHVEGLIAAVRQLRGDAERLVGAVSLLTEDAMYQGRPTRDRVTAPAAVDAVVSVATRALASG